MHRSLQEVKGKGRKVKITIGKNFACYKRFFEKLRKVLSFVSLRLSCLHVFLPCFASYPININSYHIFFRMLYFSIHLSVSPLWL